MVPAEYRLIGGVVYLLVVMALTHYRFIHPSALAAIRDLPLVARTVVDGFLYGAHPSHMPGAGLEFSQYRSYQAGDDLRRVDWKLYGRSDRYFVRESEIETSLTLRLVVDAGASGPPAGRRGGTLRSERRRPALHPARPRTGPPPPAHARARAAGADGKLAVLGPGGARPRRRRSARHHRRPQRPARARLGD